MVNYMNLIRKWYYPEVYTEQTMKRREYYFDNLKFILMILVVVGHFSMKLTYIKEIKYIMYFIYIFHMPCFVFVSGYFAKRMNAGGRLRVEKIMSVFWMYLVFKIGNVILSMIFDRKVDLSLFKDSAAPWYLLALSIWYLLVPLLEQIKPYYLIPGSFLLGLAVGYLSHIGNTFSLSRIFVFLPFFVIGFCLPKESLDKILNLRIRFLALIFNLITFGVLVLGRDKIKPFLNIIYGASSYSKSLKGYITYGALIRGIWYLTAILLSIALMLLVPRCKLFFSVLGERTMQIYMTHIWVRNGLVYSGFFAMIKAGPRYYGFLVFAGSILLTFILANSLLKKVYEVLMAQALWCKVVKKSETKQRQN